MLAKRLATIEPLVFTVLVLVTAIAPVFMWMNGYSPMAAAPSKIAFFALALGWYVALLTVSVRAFAAAETNPKVMLWLAAALGVVLVANTVLAALGKPVNPSLFIAFGLYLLFIWRVAGALERAAAGSAEVKPGAVAKTFLLLWINVIGVWVLRGKILAVAERGEP